MLSADNPKQNTVTEKQLWVKMAQSCFFIRGAIMNRMFQECTLFELQKNNFNATITTNKKTTRRTAI